MIQLHQQTGAANMSTGKRAVIAHIGSNWVDVTVQVLDMIGAERITADNENAAECAAETLADEQGSDWVFGLI
jgi:hypothetical protein